MIPSNRMLKPRIATARGACLLVLLFGGAPLRAQDAGTEGNLSLGIGSRGIALGGAHTARLDDASAVFWNPASTAGWERGHASFMHASIGFGDAAMTAFSAAYPTLRAGSFGVGITHLGTGGIESTDASGAPQGTIGFAETSLHATWALRPSLPYVGRQLGIGIGAKTLTQSLGTWSATGAGLDLGFTFEPRRAGDFAAALVLRDAIAPRLRLDEGADLVPATLQLASSYTLRLRPDLGVVVHAAVDRQRYLGWSPRAGIECSLRNRLFVRFGASRDGAAFGVGLGWKDCGLDYARLARNDAGTHPVSLGAAWGRSRVERTAALAAARARDRDAEVRAHMKARVEEHLNIAQAAYDRGDYAEALDAWKLAGGLDPADERVARGLEAAGSRLAALQAERLADATARAARAAQFELGLRAYASNDYTRALELWRDLAAQDPGDAQVQRYLEKTEQSLRELVRHAAEHAGALEKRGEWVEALAAWQRVHEVDANHSAAAPALARCRAALEGASTRRATRDASGAYAEALQLFAQGDATRAAARLADVLRVDPEHRAAADLLAQLERRSQPLTPADKTRMRELYLAGLGFFTANDFERAITEWSKILALDPGNASVAQNIDEARARMQALQAPATRGSGAP